MLRVQLRETYLKTEAMANRAQTYDAIRKLLAVLDDPFTRFLEPSRLAALRRGTAGVQQRVRLFVLG
jgi:C-terminal processing protease CtpA/Prc